MFFRERLGPHHDTSRFISGNGVLDDWLKEHAVGADRSGSARTYVWIDETEKLVAYFSLAPHIIRREELPSRVGRGSPDAIPAILLARLALDRSLQGQGYGAVLLADALDVAVEAIKRAGGRMIVVDAVNEQAVAFYEHHGFVPVPGNSNRLVLKASSAARSLGIDWP